MIAAVVLAAGGSTRLGRPKQLVEVDGEPLVRRAARAALDGGCEPVIVVLGASAAGSRAALAGLAVRAVDNQDWRGGMATSVRAGVEAAVADRPAGVALLVCDQVRLDAGVVRRLLDLAAAHPDAPVACRYGGVVGVPAVFPAAMAPGLLRLRGDRGARDLLRGAGEPAVLDWPEGALDLDAPGDHGGANPEASI